MWSRREPFEANDTKLIDDGAWVLLAETQTVRLYGRWKPASFREAPQDRERKAGKPSARDEGQK